MAVTLGYCLFHEGQGAFNYTVSSDCKVLVLGNFQRLGSIGTPQFTFSSVTYNFTVAANNSGDCSLCYYLNPPAGNISIIPKTTGLDGTFVVGFYGDNITYKTGSSKIQNHTFTTPTSFTHSPNISLNSNEYFVVLSRDSGGVGITGTTGAWFKDAGNVNVTNKELTTTDLDPNKQVNGALFYKTGSSDGIVVTASSSTTENVVSFILQPESSGATGNMFAMF